MHAMHAAVWLVGTGMMSPELDSTEMYRGAQETPSAQPSMAMPEQGPQPLGSQAGKPGIISQIDGSPSRQARSTRRTGPQGEKLIRQHTASDPYLAGSTLQLAWKLGMMLSLLAAAVVHVLQCSIPPPAKLPFLYDAAIVSLSFANFLPAAVHLNICQWRL